MGESSVVRRDERAERLRQAFANLRAAGDEGLAAAALDLEPRTAHEAITRQMVVALAEDVAEVKTRLNGLLFMVAGAIVLEVVLRLAGVG
jgi:hypothetical protein